MVRFVLAILTVGLMLTITFTMVIPDFSKRVSDVIADGPRILDELADRSLDAAVAEMPLTEALLNEQQQAPEFVLVPPVPGPKQNSQNAKEMVWQVSLSG